MVTLCLCLSSGGSLGASLAPRSRVAVGRRSGEQQPSWRHQRYYGSHVRDGITPPESDVAAVVFTAEHPTVPWSLEHGISTRFTIAIGTTNCVFSVVYEFVKSARSVGLSRHLSAVRSNIATSSQSSSAFIILLQISIQQ